MIAIRRMEAAEDRDKERYEAQRAAGLGRTKTKKNSCARPPLRKKLTPVF